MKSFFDFVLKIGDSILRNLNFNKFIIMNLHKKNPMNNMIWKMTRYLLEYMYNLMNLIISFVIRVDQRSNQSEEFYLDNPNISKQS